MANGDDEDENEENVACGFLSGMGGGPVGETFSSSVGELSMPVVWMAVSRVKDQIDDLDDVPLDPWVVLLQETIRCLGSSFDFFPRSFS